VPAAIPLVTEAGTAASPSGQRRALVVAYCFPPHAAIGTHRTLRLVAHLASHGWDVDVLTVDPAFYLSGTPVEETLERSVPVNTRVVRTRALRGFSALGRWLDPVKRAVRGPRGQGGSTAVSTVAAAAAGGAAPTPGHGGAGAGTAEAAAGVKTLVEELCAMPDKDIGWYLPAVLAGVRAFRGTPPDVVFSSAPPWTTHLVAKSLARLLGARWVADFRDPWVRSPWTRYRTAAAMSMAARLESAVVRRADAVLFTTDSARAEFATYYGLNEAPRFHTVYNGCDPSEFPRRQPEIHANRFVLLHAGTLYGGRSPAPLLSALAGLRQRHPQSAARLRVQFLGSTSFPGIDLRRTCDELGVSDIVEFLPRVERSRSLAAMQDASALLLLQSGTAMAIPGKLYEYLAAHRPVLALCEPGEMADFIRTHRLGVVAAADDTSEIESALLRLLSPGLESFAPASPDLFDGRLRAAEIARVMERVLLSRTQSLSPTENVGERRA
jgi:glycosyltransferase involved in cell wall biosynthesis